MEIRVFIFLCYPGTLMYLLILMLLYVFTIVHKIKTPKYHLESERGMSCHRRGYELSCLQYGMVWVRVV